MVKVTFHLYPLCILLDIEDSEYRHQVVFKIVFPHYFPVFLLTSLKQVPSKKKIYLLF